MWQKSEAIKIAKFFCEIFAGWASLMSGGFSVIFTAWSAFSPASHSQRYFFAILAYCSLWAMVGIIAHKNYKQLENKAKLESQLTSNLNEIRDLTATVASASAKHRELSEKYRDLDAKLEALLERKLGIEFDSANTAPSKYHSCKILIFNQSHAQNADDLKVQLVSLNDEMPTEYPQVMKEELHPNLPLGLNPAQGTSHSINPGESLAYAAFSVQMGTKRPGKVREFVANFNSHIEADSFPRSAWWVAGKKYVIKFAASAREMPRIEREFELEFFEEDDKCRITMTPIK